MTPSGTTAPSVTIRCRTRRVTGSSTYTKPSSARAANTAVVGTINGAPASAGPNVSRALPICPDASRALAGNRTSTRKVPVPSSPRAPTSLTWPCITCGPSAGIRTLAGWPCRTRAASRSANGTRSTKPWPISPMVRTACPGWAICPGSPGRASTIPAVGARNTASATSNPAARTRACAATMVARACSTRGAVTQPLVNRSSARFRSARARTTSAPADAWVAPSEVVSSRASTWPAATRSPSRTNIAAMRPGELNASAVSRFSRTVPLTSSSAVPLTDWAATTRTGWAGVGLGGGAALSPHAASAVRAAIAAARPATMGRRAF